MTDFDHPAQDQAEADVYTRMALHLAAMGWCVTPDFLPSATIHQLYQEAERLWQEGGFRPAGVGRGADLCINPDVRTDWVKWLDPKGCTRAQQEYFSALEKLRIAINRAHYLGLFEFEGHFAVYPPGTYYRKHLDQFRDMGLRTVTCILYLNGNWRTEDGGQLRIYTDERDARRYEEIVPLGGSLVTFLSDRFLHEVLPARRNRVSIAGWFKQRA